MLRHRMVIVWSEENSCYLARFPDFPEQLYISGGESYAEAARNGEEVFQLLLEKDEQMAAATRADTEKSELLSDIDFSQIDSSQIDSSQEVATLPGKATGEATGEATDKATELTVPLQKPVSFPWITTAIASIATSAVAISTLVALAFVSQGITARVKPADETAAVKADQDSEQNDTALAPQPAAAASPQLALTKEISESSPVWAIATYSDASRNINLIASGTETGQIVIRDQTSGQPVRTIAAHNDKVRSIVIAPNSRRLISSSGDGIKVWDLETGKQIYSRPSTAPVWSVAVSPDESRLISGAYDGNIAVWDLNTGKLLYSVGDGAAVWSVAVSPSGDSFVSGDSNRVVRQWSLKGGQPIRTFAGHKGDVRAVAISPDGKTLASGSWDQTVKLWSLSTGELQTTLEGHSDRVISIAISSDGNTLASSSADDTVKLWNLSNYQLTENLNARSDLVLSVAFSPSGQALIAGGGKEIEIWQ